MAQRLQRPHPFRSVKRFDTSQAGPDTPGLGHKNKYYKSAMPHCQTQNGSQSMVVWPGLRLIRAGGKILKGVFMAVAAMKTDGARLDNGSRASTNARPLRRENSAGRGAARGCRPSALLRPQLQVGVSQSTFRPSWPY